jgi:hypothetical protein
MPQEKQTLGQAIDQIMTALEPLDVSTRKTALIAVCTQLSVDLPSKSPAVQSLGALSPATMTAVATTDAGVSQTVHPQVDIRSLKESKKPATAQQMACIVAYYLKELVPTAERKESINASDLEILFKQARFKLPKRIAQVLPDAKSAGYFDSAGRGEYKLNAVGHNLVVHNLPSGSADAE